MRAQGDPPGAAASPAGDGPGFAMRLRRSLPNVLTWARLALAPLAVGAILEGRREAGLGLFATAALTDLLDGALARRWGVTTEWGAHLDPVADKVLLSGVYLALAAAGMAPRWLVMLIFGRDALLLLGAATAYAWRGLRQFPPSAWGKLSTVLQVLSAVAWMAPPYAAVARALLWPTALATIWSGAHYFWRGWRAARVH